MKQNVNKPQSSYYSSVPKQNTRRDQAEVAYTPDVGYDVRAEEHQLAYLQVKCLEFLDYRMIVRLIKRIQIAQNI
jgi:hypothetical protein